MPNNNRKLFDSLVSRTKIYLVIIFVLLLMICFFNTKMIIPSILVYIAIMGYTYFANNKRKSEISEQLQDLTLTVDSAAKSSLINAPFPLLILETDGNIIWRSPRFVSDFANVDINSYINDLIIDIKDEISKRENEKERSIIRNIEVGKKQYQVKGQFVKSKRKDKKKAQEYMLILYFMDETEKVQLEKQCEDEKTCVGIIMIDNYEETIQRLETEKKPQIIAEVEKEIYEWANSINAILTKSERNTYICIFKQKYLEQIKESKFVILDNIKEIVKKEKIQLTLSIAISNEGKDNKEIFKTANDTMDIVLGRGGDQAAIRENGKYQFFGGKVEEVEKRTKVKARVVAHALEELIQNSSNVIIMGHTNPDIDAMGSAIGIYRLAKTLGKDAFILTDISNPSIKSFIDTLQEDEEYQKVIINESRAMELSNNETLVVVVDTHKKNYVESTKLLDKSNKIVIIDHHRRSADFIEQSTLTFQEVYASSAAELVTELLQYTQKEVTLKTIEAESLYAGIMMDTKNFTFKTGVRTFEAAAYLRKCGIDIIKIKKWFQSDMVSYKKIADIVKNSEIINNTIALSTYLEEEKDANLICAKAADELLTIGDITASFVLGKMENKICISGRSIGDINVQMILEKLGGGGHITLAGAQLENRTIEEAKQELIEKINEYFAEKE